MLFKLNQKVKINHHGFASDVQIKMNGLVGKVVDLMKDKDGNCFGYVVQSNGLVSGFSEKSLKEFS
jgi:hypothetical protein